MSKKKKKTAKKSPTTLAPVKQEFQTLARVDQDFSEKQLSYIKNIIAPTLNEVETRLFIYRAQKLGLNPLEGEIYAYASFQTVGGKRQRKMVMIVSRDGKRKKAFQSPELKSIKTEAIYTKQAKVQTYKLVFNEEGDEDLEKTPEEVLEKKIIRVKEWEGGTLWGARCEITRHDFEKPFVVTASLKEYKRKTAIWNNKPETMIKKVAESQCLSIAFPLLLAGIYDESERWADTPEEKEMPKIKDGKAPANETQMETIKSLGGDAEKLLTRQEAAEKIKQLSLEKENEKNS